MTADRGLCGAFNTNLIRETVKYLAKYGAQNVDLYIVGRKGKDFFRRLGSSVCKDYTGISSQLNFAQAELILNDLLVGYQRQPWVAVPAAPSPKLPENKKQRAKA